MRRSKYSKEFKIEACKLVINNKQSISSSASGLGIGTNVLSRWIKAYKINPEGSFPGSGTKIVTIEDSEKLALQKELKRVTLERDILKKAMAYFVESPK
jgi:transposase